MPWVAGAAGQGRPRSLSWLVAIVQIDENQDFQTAMSSETRASYFRRKSRQALVDISLKMGRFRTGIVIGFTHLREFGVYSRKYVNCLQRETDDTMDEIMEKDDTPVPLSESSVSHELAEIQKRCAELLQDSASTDNLTLEEPALVCDAFDPYNRG